LTFENEFDAVFSNATLHWLPRADDVAIGVARALRAGGRFVAELGGAHNVRTVREALQAELAQLGLEGYATPAWFFPTVPEYARILERAGLFVRSVVWFERPTRLEGPSGLADWLELFCLPLLRAVGDRRAELVRGVEQRCRERLFVGGDWWLDYTRLRVVATKP
jgi:SAM-dependent methyltransferase